MSRLSKNRNRNWKVKGNWNIDWESTFVNPYTFVPFTGKCVRSKPETGTLSGYIECELKTYTPLFIPNTSGNNIRSGKFPFYYFYGYKNLEDLQPHDVSKLHDKPVIPGSIIRGAVRSLFEAATSSCLGAVDTESLLFRRSSVPRKAAGILKYEDGEWVLYRAGQ